ncbi:MAG: DNA polymerase III subunit beta [Candidatus Pacebacteria bacterium]|nr:DNA polymerase III subunit beta [Candidatus Paceibacterota bacterium]
MKLKCITNKINIAISKAEKITGKNLNLPILSCVLLEAQADNLIIKTTNLDLGIEISIPAEIEEEGIVAVNGTVIKNLLSNISNKDNLLLETKNNNLTVSSKNNTAIIKSHPNDDFPSIPKIKGNKIFTIDAKKIIKGLKSVWYSASVSSIKPELSSVLINIDENFLYFAATDSFRLAELKIPIKSKEKVENILIPFKNIPEIIRTFEDIEGDLKIECAQNQISFKYNNIYLTSRIVDGVFPDYKQLIPKERTTEAVVLLDDLANVFKIINIFSDKFNQINFKISPKNKKFEIKSKNNEVGETVNLVPASLSGADLEINFNYKYIADCFQSITTDSLVLQFNGLNKPLIIRGVSDNQFLYLVMPMNK